MKCEICGKEIGGRGWACHCLKSHNINTHEYYDKFLKKENEGFCKICGKPTKWRDTASGYQITCSKKCFNDYKKTNEYKNKQYNTIIQRYGKEGLKSEKILNKKKQSCLEHFGVEYPGQSIEIQKKRKKTISERYGENYEEQRISKCKETWKNTLGVEHPMKCDTVKNKVKQTCLSKYGVDNCWKSNEVRQKCKDTLKNNYGVTVPFYSEEIKEKAKQTMNKKYGVDWISQNEIYKNKMQQNQKDNHNGKLAWNTEKQQKTRKSNKQIDQRLDENNL